MAASRHARVAATSAAIPRIAEELDAFWLAEGLPSDAAWPLHVALDEVVSNIVSCAAAVGNAPTIEISFRRNVQLIEIVVADDGPAFDPLAWPAPDLTAPLPSRQPGGIGIHLVKGLLDEVCYERTARNILTLRKRIQLDPRAGKAGSDGYPPEHS